MSSAVIQSLIDARHAFCMHSRKNIAAFGIRPTSCIQLCLYAVYCILWITINIAFKPPWWWVQTGSQDPSSDATSLQNAFDDLFFTYQVDLAFYGHIHYYTRSACYCTVLAIILVSLY